MCSRSGLLKGRLDKVRQVLREVQTDLALDTEDIPDLAYLLAMNYGPDGTSPPVITLKGDQEQTEYVEPDLPDLLEPKKEPSSGEEEGQ